jgi:hypothetical protein
VSAVDAQLLLLDVPVDHHAVAAVAGVELGSARRIADERFCKRQPAPSLAMRATCVDIVRQSAAVTEARAEPFLEGAVLGQRPMDESIDSASDEAITPARDRATDVYEALDLSRARALGRSSPPRQRPVAAAGGSILR